MTTSLMPDPAALGLKQQDLADSGGVLDGKIALSRAAMQGGST
jgi:hypothetical protein